MSAEATNLLPSRTWLVVSGLLFILVGIAAIGSPFLFTVIIVRLLGYFILASGIISLALAITGRQAGHRLLEVALGVLRIAAGIVLLACLKSSLLTITLIFAVYMVCEGVVMASASFKHRPEPGWSLLLFNGMIALVLGIMVFSRWPSSSLWVLGLFFGIHVLFNGGTRLALGLFLPREAGTRAA